MTASEGGAGPDEGPTGEHVEQRLVETLIDLTDQAADGPMQGGADCVVELDLAVDRTRPRLRLSTLHWSS